MSLIPTWDKISQANNSTTTEFGGNWGNLISDYYNGVNIALTEPTKVPIPGTLTRFKHEKLGLFDNDQSHHIVFSADDIDTGGTRKIKFRRMNSPFEEDYAVLESLPQPFINKIINADLNSLSNIEDADIKAAAAIATSKLAEGSLFAKTNVANTFTAAQKIQYAFTGALTLYRPEATQGIGTGINFSLLNDATPTPAEVNYASIYASLVLNDFGAEQGGLEFYIRNGASFVSRMFLDHLNRLRIGLSGTGIIIDPTGITSTSKVLTSPNYDGEIRLRGIVPNQHKEGWCDFANPNQIIGELLLAPLQGYYSTITSIQGVQGTGLSLTTGTVSNSAAGWVVILPSGITRRSWNPYLFFRTSLPTLSSGDSFFFYGFTTRASLLPPSNSPIGNTESGVLIGYKSFDTEFKVFHNDGSGGVLTVVPISPSVPVPATATTYSLEIKMTSAGISCAVYNSGTTLLGSVLLSSGAIPATTTNLNLQALLFNPTGVTKGTTPTKLYFKSDK